MQNTILAAQLHNVTRKLSNGNSSEDETEYKSSTTTVNFY